MIKVQLLFGILAFALWVFCLIDVIGNGDRARHLPKVAWVLLVLFFPFVGSVAWLAAGRPQRAPRRPSPHERPQPPFPEYDRPGRAAAADPSTDEDFLRQVRERAEEQRRRYQQQRREQADEDGTPGPA